MLRESCVGALWMVRRPRGRGWQAHRILGVGVFQRVRRTPPLARRGESGRADDFAVHARRGCRRAVLCRRCEFVRSSMLRARSEPERLLSDALPCCVGTFDVEHLSRFIKPSNIVRLCLVLVRD